MVAVIENMSSDTKDEVGDMQEMLEKVQQSAQDITGGRKRRKGKSSKKRGTKRRGSKRRGSKRRGTRKRGPSKWIAHVKAFCRKTGVSFPSALKNPACRKSFKH